MCRYEILKIQDRVIKDISIILVAFRMRLILNTVLNKLLGIPLMLVVLPDFRYWTLSYIVTFGETIVKNLSKISKLCYNVHNIIWGAMVSDRH